MRVLSLARALFALLAFQLALGIQVGGAYAATISAAPSAQWDGGDVARAHARGSTATSADDACPMHASAHAGSTRTGSAHIPSADSSTDKHDCCKSSGCQGHCGSVSLAFNFAAIRSAAPTVSVLPVRETPFAAAPVDAHFRPPIAS